MWTRAWFVFMCNIFCFVIFCCISRYSTQEVYVPMNVPINVVHVVRNFTCIYLRVLSFLHAVTLNMVKENKTLVNARWNGLADFCKRGRRMVLLFHICWPVLQFVRHLLCYNRHLRPSCFFQLSLLPCLQQILMVMGMVRTEQRLHIDVSINTLVSLECLYYVLVNVSHNICCVK